MRDLEPGFLLFKTQVDKFPDTDHREKRRIQARWAQKGELDADSEGSARWTGVIEEETGCVMTIYSHHYTPITLYSHVECNLNPTTL